MSAVLPFPQVREGHWQDVLTGSHGGAAVLEATTSTAAARPIPRKGLTLGV